MKKSNFRFLLSILFLFTIFIFCFLNFKLFLSSGWKSLLQQKEVNQKVFSETEKKYNENFSNKTNLITANGAVHLLLGQKEMNNVLKLEDHTLIQLQEKVIDITQKAKTIIEFNNKMEKIHIPFVYMQAPYKTCVLDSQMPIGKFDYSNDNADSILKKLNEAGVQTLDFRMLIHKDDLDHSSLFSKQIIIGSQKQDFGHLLKS